MLTPKNSKYLANLIQKAIYNKDFKLIEKIRKIKDDKDMKKYDII